MNRRAGKGLFVAVGHSAQRLTSLDGEHWSPPQLGKGGGTYRDVCYGGGRFVAVGEHHNGHSIIGTSSDGVEWTTQLIDGRENKVGNSFWYVMRMVAYGNGLYLGAGAGPAFVRTSKDSLTWSEWTLYKQLRLTHLSQLSFLGEFRKAVFGNERFVALGNHAWRGISTNGTEWTSAEGTNVFDAFVDVAFGNGVFVGVGLHGLRMRSTDGLRWTDRVVGEEGEHINSVVWTGERFAAIGAGATYFSSDGNQWERQPNENPPLRCAYGNGVFIGSRWKGRLFRSEDAVTWKQVFKCEEQIEAVAFGG